jgi:isoleucyl-tRNA synthetase
VVNDQGDTVALDLYLSPGLVLAGHAREAIRLVQEARKASGFEVTDRISLTWAADGPVAEALTTHEGLVADEVLATQVRRVSAGEPVEGAEYADDALGLQVWVRQV